MITNELDDFIWRFIVLYFYDFCPVVLSVFGNARMHGHNRHTDKFMCRYRLAASASTVVRAHEIRRKPRCNPSLP